MGLYVGRAFATGVCRFRTYPKRRAKANNNKVFCCLSDPDSSGVSYSLKLELVFVNDLVFC